jgi:hypothetical protein
MPSGRAAPSAEKVDAFTMARVLSGLGRFTMCGLAADCRRHLLGTVVVTVVTSVALSLSTARSQELVDLPLGNQQTTSALRISEVRLDLSPHSESEPSSILRFNLENDGIGRLSDVTLRIAIFERATKAALIPRAIVRPFSVRTEATLEPGYSIEYEMLFRNLAADCDCVPKVEVLSARFAR